MFSDEGDIHWPWLVWLLLGLVGFITILTGFPIQSSNGQYVGYVTAVEQNGAIFKGWNVYLKTDLQSSNEDVACVDRDNQKLIEDLQKAQENKTSLTLQYLGTWQYPIGQCPNADWMIKSIK